MNIPYERSGWHPTDGWIEVADHLPEVGQEVWVARWHTVQWVQSYQVIKDQLISPMLFLSDARSNGWVIYWQPVATDTPPATPPAPESLPPCLRPSDPDDESEPIDMLDLAAKLLRRAGEVK